MTGFIKGVGLLHFILRPYILSLKSFMHVTDFVIHYDGWFKQIRVDNYTC